MKVTAKILILILAISLAIGGVMVFIKTKIEPPKATVPVDQFSENLIGGIDTLGQTQTPMQQDSLFVALSGKTRFYVLEDKISKDDGNEAIGQLCSTYTMLFLERSMEKFSRKSWPVNDFYHMRRTAAELRSIRDFDNCGVLRKSSLDSLALIEKIIDDYWSARAVCQQTSFAGINNARATISKARQYAQDRYLSNCTDLVEVLNNVKPALAASHYDYVYRCVERLSDFKSYSIAYFNTLVSRADEAITEYDNKASALYGSKRNVDALFEKAELYIQQAAEYYN